MQTERTLIEDLKHQYKHGGMTIKLIFINLVVFVGIGLIHMIGNLMQNPTLSYVKTFTEILFTLDTDFTGFLHKPWGLITSIFAHFDFFHILFNMLMLYFSGRLFEQLFDQKRLLYTYILGGIAGGLFEILAHSLFPLFESVHVLNVGASGSVMAIFMALAFYRPNLEVNFFGFFPVRLIILAGIFFIMNLLSLASQDGTAHFAHIGGAVIGIISINNLNTDRNFITLIQNGMNTFFSFLKKLFGKREPKFTVKKGGTARGGFKTDEEFNYDAKQRQIQVDKILDKIAKSGYESLSKAEKEFLFDQSKK